MSLSLYDWTRVTGEVAGSATFRQQLEDFQVTETLRFEPSNEGAHHLLYLEKRNLNTDIVAHKLRRFAEVKETDIGYAGKKDRFAIACQWFSVQLPLLREVDWQQFNDDEIKVLEVTRHEKKLRIGAVKQNHFKIRLRDFKGDQRLLESKLEKLQQIGFANYFGEQRFGHGGDNLRRGLDLLASKKRLKNRNLQGLLFSAVRSSIFNHLLSQRIEQGQFDQLMLGDYAQLDGSESGFRVEDLTKENSRFEQNDLHPTLPMVGRGRSQVSDDAEGFESAILAEHSEIIEQLERKGLNAERRSIRIFPKNVEFEWHNEGEKSNLVIAFSLPKGAYATSLLRELVDLQIPDRALNKNPEPASEKTHENITQ